MEKNDLQSYLKRLQDLDGQIEGDDELNAEFMIELNKIINGLSQDMQINVAKEVRKVPLKFINTSNNPDPEFATEGSSGFDIRANLSKNIVINEHSIVLIPTGLFVEVESGVEVQVRSRSGLASKSHMFVLNSPGTVDSDYRGEIMVILANLSDSPQTIRNGDRIAQAVVCPVYGTERLELIKVKKLSETKRSSGGFGHTGVQ